MATPADFTETEQKLVSTLLLQRYGKPVQLQLADSELQLDPGSEDLILCPALYWSARGAHFVVCKIAEGCYRCQFYYSEAEQYGTGKEAYVDLNICVLTLLQVQSDHERQLAGISAGATQADIDDEYSGPLVI